MEMKVQLSTIYTKIRNNQRLNREEGLFLLQKGELLELGDLASEIRFRKNPENTVTFVVDTNPNYRESRPFSCKVE
jgi:cyclic dehypoxanthinyl futalosine synthase